MFVSSFRSTSARMALTVFFVLSAVVTASAGVTVKTPSNWATVGSPVHFVASATSTDLISLMRIYIDWTSAYSVRASSLDTYLQLSAGTHAVTVQAWDTAGSVQKYSFHIKVTSTSTSSSGSTSGSSSTTGTTYSNIQNMKYWQTCSSCAAAGGTGPSVSHSVTYNVSSPSMTGSSAEFSIAGTEPYSDAIWWRQLGANSGATHFVYDLYFYVKNTGASEALEFDVNQSTGGSKFVFGTQCGVNYDHQWDVWANYKWHATGIGCSVKAYAWNHLTAEFYRSSSAVNFVSITLNGSTHYINWSFSPIGSSANEINVAFQMDQTGSHTAYDVWLDKVQLHYW